MGYNSTKMDNTLPVINQMIHTIITFGMINRYSNWESFQSDRDRYSQLSGV